MIYRVFFLLDMFNIKPINKNAKAIIPTPKPIHAPFEYEKIVENVMSAHKSKRWKLFFLKNNAKTIGLITTRKSPKKLGLPKVENILFPNAHLQIKGSNPFAGGAGKYLVSMNWITAYIQTIYVANIKKFTILFRLFLSSKQSIIIIAKKQYINLLIKT